jgi:hypothetical protein
LQDGGAATPYRDPSPGTPEHHTQGQVTFVIKHYSPILHPHINISTLQSSQRVAIMELTALTLINFQTLLISISVVALSIVDFYFTGHAIQTIEKYFPPGAYDFQSPGQPFSRPKDPANEVLLSYSYLPETMILVSTGLSIFAGLLGIAGFWFARKVGPHLHTFP